MRRHLVHLSHCTHASGCATGSASPPDSEASDAASREPIGRTTLPPTAHTPVYTPLVTEHPPWVTVSPSRTVRTLPRSVRLRWARAASHQHPQGVVWASACPPGGQGLRLGGAYASVP
jgi:hypothetical protein